MRQVQIVPIETPKQLGQDPVGDQLRPPSSSHPLEIIGAFGLGGQDGGVGRFESVSLLQTLLPRVREFGQFARQLRQQSLGGFPAEGDPGSGKYR